VNNFGTLLLKNPAHYVDGSVMSIKQGCGSNKTWAETLVLVRLGCGGLLGARVHD
jgi:hypothetical protein